MKTKEELNEIKEEMETLNKKLAELTDEELAQVSGGGVTLPCRSPSVGTDPNTGKCMRNISVVGCPCPDVYCRLR